MLALTITVFCLIVSFAVSSKKMKVKSIAQAVLAFILAFLVLFLLPESPFVSLTKRIIGFDAYLIFEDVLTSLTTFGISITNLIAYAVLFLTILSIFSIIEYVKDHIKKNTEREIRILIPKMQSKKENSFFEYKIYLLFCKLIC